MDVDLSHNPRRMPPSLIKELEHLARKLPSYPRWVEVLREAVQTLRHQEIAMATEANVLTAYKTALTNVNAALATATAADQAKDATIADLTSKLAAASTGGKDAADLAAEAQAITDLNLNSDGTPKPVAPPAA